MTCDVAVIGGGVIGLSCAWRLAQRGAKVQLFERGEIGREASWAAAGMLAAQCEAAVHPAASPGQNSPFFDLCLQSRALYPDIAEELLEISGIDIELSLITASKDDARTPGILYIARENDDIVSGRFLAQRASGQSVESTEFQNRQALWLAEEGQVEPRRLVAALKIACEISGVVVHESTPVRLDEVLNQHETVLVGSGAWSSEVAGDAVPPVHPVAGEVLAMRPSEPLNRILYSRDVYMVPRRDGRVLIGATMEERGFDKSLENSSKQHLLETAQAIAPAVANWRLLDHWAGLRPATPDGLPVMGRTSVENLFVATGHFRNGILLAPITAQLMADCILNSIEPPEEFSGKRFAPGVLTA